MIEVCLFALLLAGTQWCVSPYFVDADITPKWYWSVFVVSAWLFRYAYIRLRARHSIAGSSNTFLLKGVAVAVLLVVFSQAGYALFQWTGLLGNKNGFNVAGSFDNPAGMASALAFSVSFGLYVWHSTKVLWLKLCIGFMLAVILFAVVATESRSGVLSAGAVILVYALMNVQNTNAFATAAANAKSRKSLTKHKGVGLILLVATIVCGGVWLYHIKKPSADGRLLIWQCTLNMIADKPLFGYGHGGFEANYMNYQAQYFEQHSKSDYAMLADSVGQPFNEYLRVLTDYGVVGFVALILLCWFVGREYVRHCKDSPAMPYAMMCLCAIVVFSLFSYPFRYPHTWIFSAMSIVLITRCNKTLRIIIGHIVFRAAMLLVALTVVIVAAIRMKAEIEWGNVALHSDASSASRLARYRVLMDDMKTNRLFLYNYAAELNVAGRYAESLEVAEACQSRMADYDLQMLIADNCQHLHQYNSALQHYNKASFMCPNRFVPLYKMFQLYGSTSDSAARRSTAVRIFNKPLKVDSYEIRNMKAEMKAYLSEQ